jgi:hypothetical protein
LTTTEYLADNRYSKEVVGVGTLAVEAERTRRLFERVETVEEVAETLAADDPRRAKLLAVVDEALAEADPIRPVVAADVLAFTEKTVRTWVREGVLTAIQERPRMLLDARRLHDVLHLVRDLKEAGRTRGLLDEVYRRLADQALIDREDLAVSLEQMRRGQGRVVRPGGAAD